MQAYSLQGTPSLVLIDRQGIVRLEHFGHLDDLPLGALIGQLVAQAPAPELAQATTGQAAGNATQGQCDDKGCAIG
jgi:hypothetical protein